MPIIKLPSTNGSNPRHGIKRPKNRSRLSPASPICIQLETTTLQWQHRRIEQIRTALRFSTIGIEFDENVFGWRWYKIELQIIRERLGLSLWRWWGRTVRLKGYKILLVLNIFRIYSILIDDHNQFYIHFGLVPHGYYFSVHLCWFHHEVDYSCWFILLIPFIQ